MDLVFTAPLPPEMPLRAAIRDAHRQDETAADSAILAAAEIPEAARDRIAATARRLVEAVRRERLGKGGLDAFLHEYALSSPEGVALMCLAEALLRIPDAETVDKLIRDKIAAADWHSHLGHSGSLFVNASTWALMLTGRLLRPENENDIGDALRRLIARSSEPVWRQAVTAAMRILAGQFVMGRTIEEALDRAREPERHGYRHSYDMLGEAARTMPDAERYHAAYAHAIAAIGGAAAAASVEAAPGISVKLSALHPRYDMAQRAKRRLMVRLVKGAYWDTEIKRAQERGLDGYPVFTRKLATDVSYLACAKQLFAAGSALYPQFATHNAHSLAAILELSGGRTDWEFQRLHGMGEALYDEVVGRDKMNRPCRVYAPVGGHEDLLAYLVRRLLENGANTSFVNRIVDERAPIDEIVADPIARLAALPRKPHPKIPLPRDLFQPERCNSQGLDLADPRAMADLRKGLAQALRLPARAAPIVGGTALAGSKISVFDPSDRRRQIGTVVAAGPEAVEQALARAVHAAPSWNNTPAEQRAAILERAADLYEQHRAALMALIIREGGRTVPAALSEVREAVDFLRYYAARARAEFAMPQRLPGPTGEQDEIGLHGRGVFSCISPWNFPLSIFTGQIAAALAAGNAVLAKPAEQTPLVAAAAVRHLLAAGIPGDVLHLLPGDGETVGAALVADSRIGGIAFTGSTETARAINQSLAARPGPIVPLIAETGGQNAMIVDSSALPEQVVADALISAFDSAGQRCSALRILCLQDDIAEPVLAMLKGALQELVVGDPRRLSTDVGPVIDAEARDKLVAHVARMRERGWPVFQLPPPEGATPGTFFAPALIEVPSIDALALLAREVFGPVLHVVRWHRDQLPALVDAINATGYGLTHGIHTRIDETAAGIVARVHAGNIYINRNMVGAVVGVQPFGGHGLSGTGPKAGGPHYLRRLVRQAVRVPLVATVMVRPVPA